MDGAGPIAGAMVNLVWPLRLMAKDVPGSIKNIKVVG